MFCWMNKGSRIFDTLQYVIVSGLMTIVQYLQRLNGVLWEFLMWNVVGTKIEEL